MEKLPICGLGCSESKHHGDAIPVRTNVYKNGVTRKIVYLNEHKMCSFHEKHLDTEFTSCNSLALTMRAEMKEVCNNSPQHTNTANTIIIEDFNSRIGQNYKDLKYIMSRSSTRKETKNKHRLLQFCPTSSR